MISLHKNNKWLLPLLLSAALLLTACGGGDAPTGEDEVGETPEGIPELSGPVGSLPVMVTSIGQSADVQMVKALLDRTDMEYAFEPLVDADGLEGMNTVVMVVGGSSKGLGAAGIRAEEELERTRQLIEAAEANGAAIIAMHIGGEARRGDLSDGFIREVLPSADYIIMVDGADGDGLFTDMATQHQIPMQIAGSISEAGTPLTDAIQQ